MLQKQLIDSEKGLKSPMVNIHTALDLMLPGLISQESIARGEIWLDVPDSGLW